MAAWDNSAAYEASSIIKVSPGKLFGFTGYNAKAEGQFIQIHDSATLPADTAVPSIIIYVTGQSNFLWSSEIEMYFQNGIIICNSSTGSTKTIGSADCWFNVLFE